jgi:hypothetical protein
LVARNTSFEFLDPPFASQFTFSDSFSCGYYIALGVRKFIKHSLRPIFVPETEAHHLCEKTIENRDTNKETVPNPPSEDSSFEVMDGKSKTKHLNINFD